MNNNIQNIIKFFPNSIYKRVLVETILDGVNHEGFGITQEQEKVFISPKIVKDLDIRVGDIIEALIAPNEKSKADSTPWMVCHPSMTKVLPEEAPEEILSVRQIELSIEERITGLLQQSGNEYPHKVGELSEKLDINTDQVQLALQRMHNAGDIWEAKIERKGSQDRASYVLWALDDEWFAVECE
jgi:hypothetical protein